MRHEVPLTRRRAAAVTTSVLAAGSGAWVLLPQDEHAYLLGGLMTLQLIVVLGMRSELDRRKDVGNTGDPASDLPTFD